MGKGLALVLILVCLISSSIILDKPVSGASAVGNTWSFKAAMLQAGSDLGVASANGKIYAIGSSNLEYDPSTNVWTYKSPMPTSRLGFAAVGCGGKIYCIGGTTSNGTSTGINEEYNPITYTWATKASMPTPISGLQGNVVEGKIYMIGDISSTSGSAYSLLVEIYDPTTDTWTSKTSLANATISYYSAAINNKIYFPGSTVTQIYDVDNNSWTTGKPMPASNMEYGLPYFAACATTGIYAPARIYVFSELWVDLQIPNLSLQSNQVYNPENDSWSFGSAPPSQIADFGVAVVNDTIYLMGGSKAVYPNMLSWSSGPDVSIHANNQQYIPIGYGTVAPIISMLLSDNSTLKTNAVPLNFTVNKSVNWLGYSLDGQQNVTLNGNTTLAGLSSGVHNVTVYANDTFGNIGASETTTFTIAKPFPILPVAAVSVVVVALAIVSFLVYFKKHKNIIKAQSSLVKKSGLKNNHLVKKPIQ